MQKFKVKRVGTQIVIPTKNFISGFATAHFGNKRKKVVGYGLHIFGNTTHDNSWWRGIHKWEKSYGSWIRICKLSRYES
jgi:hypothetical protein